MKIVDVNEFYAEQGGGVRTYVNQKLEAAAAAGHELVVIAPGPADDEIERLGGRIIWVKGPEMPFDPRYYVLYREKAVHRLLDRERPDVIEGSSPWTAGWFAARYRGSGAKAFIYHQDPVAVYPHTFLDRWFSSKSIDGVATPYWQYVKKLAGHFDATVVAGQWLADRLTAHGVPRAQAVPFGIDRERFSPELTDPELRRELLRRCGLTADAALLVGISRYHPEKRLPTLFQAIERVRRERPVGFVVFGDGPFRRQIDESVGPGVHLAGFVEDREFIARSLASADGFLHGSAAETFGFVIAEAMQSGTPIISPDRGGAFELVEPEFSETYPPGDAVSCAGAILRLLARDRQNLRRAAVAAAERNVRSKAEHFSALFDAYARLAANER